MWRDSPAHRLNESCRETSWAPPRGQETQHQHRRRASHLRQAGRKVKANSESLAQFVPHTGSAHHTRSRIGVAAQCVSSGAAIQLATLPAAPEGEPSRPHPARQTSPFPESAQPAGGALIHVNLPPALPHQRKARHRGTAADSFLLPRMSYEISQSRAHFLRRAEQTILSGFFRRAHDFADRSQPHALIMPHLKNRALPRRQSAQNLPNSSASAPGFPCAARDRCRPAVPQPCPCGPARPSLVSTTELSSRRTLRFRSASKHKLLTILIQPGVEATVEAKRVQVFIYPQERFLVNVVGFLGRTQQIRRQPQDTLIV